MVNKTEEEDKEVDSMAETVEYNEKIFLSELEASLQELQKQGSKAGLKYRAMVLAQSLFESLYRKANSGDMKDSDALKLLESLVKAAGVDKEPAGTTQVNVQANIGLPFPQGVKKVAQFVEAVEEG